MTTPESFLRLLKKCRFSGLMVTGPDGERHYHIHGTTTPRWQLILTATEEKETNGTIGVETKGFWRETTRTLVERSGPML